MNDESRCRGKSVQWDSMIKTNIVTLEHANEIVEFVNEFIEQ